MSQIAARRLLATLPRAERIIRVSANSLTVPEGASATLRVRLSSRPRTGQTVTVTVMSNDITEATVSPGSRQFSDSNWADWQDFTVAGAQDSDGNDENSSIVLAATGGGYDDTAAVAVTVEDDENKGLRLSDMSLTVGGTVTSRTIGVRLRTEPTGDVDVAASVTGNLVSVSPTSRTFTQSTWNDQQVFTVNLDDTSGSGSSILALDPSGADYAAVATTNVPITIEASIPGEVTNVMATVRKHERLTIGWNAASLATSYNFRFKKSTAANWTNRTGLSATQQIERELDPSTTYDVQVQGVNAAGTGPWSTLVQVATLTGNRQVIQLAASAYSYTSVPTSTSKIWTFRINRPLIPIDATLLSSERNNLGLHQVVFATHITLGSYFYVTFGEGTQAGRRLSTAFDATGTMQIITDTEESLVVTSSTLGAAYQSFVGQNGLTQEKFNNAFNALSTTDGTEAATLILRDYSPD